MAKTTWTYEDEQISCKFYLKHGDESYKKLDDLMKSLSNKFPKNSVKLKLKNYEYIHTDGAKGMANYSFLSKYVYRQLTSSKRAKGLKIARKHTADVANISVRNILTMLSIYKGEITSAEMDATNKFFNYKCPYTGRDLTTAINNRLSGIPDSSIAIDHIVPQNKEYCGLNVYGNLVWVDSKANGRKGKKDYKEFLLTDTVIASTATPVEIQNRIDKIEAFQLASGYDASVISKTISPILSKHYEDIQTMQVETAAKIAKAAKL